MSLSFKKILMTWMLASVLLFATNALAQGQHHGAHHSHHQGHSASPFDVKNETKSLHCQLQSHTHFGFCPHSVTGKNTPLAIAADCGGKTSGSIPNSTSFNGDFAEINNFSYVHFLPGNKLASSIVSNYHRFIDTLDPPPRVL